jgi:hypothetical protein
MRKGQIKKFGLEESVNEKGKKVGFEESVNEEGAG